MNDSSAWLYYLLLFAIELILITKLFNYVRATYRQFQEIKRNGSFVKGRVVSHIIKDDIDGHTLYAEVAEYIGADGRIYTTTSDKFRVKRSKVYAEVTVLYNKDNSSEALINPVDRIVFRMLILFIVVLGILLFDLFLVNFYILLPMYS